MRLTRPFGTLAGDGWARDYGSRTASDARRPPTFGVALPLGREIAHTHAVPLLQLFALTLSVIPSDTVFKPFGAVGSSRP